MAMAMAFSCSSSFSPAHTSSSAAPHAGACLKTFEGLRGVDNTKMVKSSLSYFQKVNPACGVRATAVESPPAAVPNQKIRVKLRSYWVPLIEQASNQILEAARNTNSKVMGPVRLPTKRRIYCVLRSPHVDKDSREHFEKRTHQRIIDLISPNAETIDALMQLDLPEGVDVEVKL